MTRMICDMIGVWLAWAIARLVEALEEIAPWRIAAALHAEGAHATD